MAKIVYEKPVVSDKRYRVEYRTFYTQTWIKFNSHRFYLFARCGAWSIRDEYTEVRIIDTRPDPR